MPLSPEEKASRHRQRLLDKAAELQTSTYLRKFVAPIFQEMIRAEFGAKPDGYERAVVDGDIRDVPRYVGECVCVTCGKVEAWNSGIKGMHTGHFIGSRRNSVLLEEKNVAPQCSHCNFYLSGNPAPFVLWMETVRGAEEVNRLRQLKTASVSFTKEQLVDLRIEYTRRLKVATERMKVDIPF